MRVHIRGKAATLLLGGTALAVLAVLLLAGAARETRAASQKWGDLDCDTENTTRDNQALLRNVLSQAPLSQTEPCPDIGTSEDLSGFGTKAWGDNDCDGEISTRDNQALLRFVLSQNALSQTEPCPDIGSTVETGGGTGTATPVVTETPSPTATPAPTTFRFAYYYGDPDTFEGTVTETTLYPMIPATGGYDDALPPLGGQFLAVDMTVTNIGPVVDQVGIDAIRLRDSLHREFTLNYPNRVDTGLVAENYFGRMGIQENLEPGDTRDFVFIFVVPVGATGFSVERCPMDGCDKDAPAAGSPGGSCDVVFPSLYADELSLCGTVDEIALTPGFAVCASVAPIDAPAGMTFAKVLMNVRNFANRPYDVEITSFRLRDDHDNLYTMDFADQDHASISARCLSGLRGIQDVIQPGVSYDEVLVFLVPIGTTGLTAEACPGAGC